MLLWPGDERARRLADDGTLLRAMVQVEAAWLAALVSNGIAPRAAADDLAGLVRDDDAPAVAADAEPSANPVVPLLHLLRQRLRGRNELASDWLHRGLTSQDVLDSALVLVAAEVLKRMTRELDAQAAALVRLADGHRGSVMAGRTLTQHAVPITFGLKAAQWLTGVLDARRRVADAAAALPAQLGGAAGTMAATCELARRSGAPDPARAALDVADATAAELGLRSAVPWHSSRAAVTRVGDALVTATDAWGRIARDVLVLARPEIGELAEPAGRGGSSTMPHKANPVLSVLVHRTALAAPAAAAQLHLAAAEAVDERPDGAWHVEWATLATLCRRTVVAAAQTTELLEGLRVDAERMAATARAARADLLAERRALAAVLERADDGPGAEPDDPAAYLGAADLLVDAVLERARAALAGRP
jgi:3-carboxy-cis,cis-muconate cycloisomerase